MTFKNFTPGPVPMYQGAKDGIQYNLPYFRTSEFSKIMLECEKNILKIFNAPEKSRVIFLTASGTAAMEASILNLVSLDEKSLVFNGGTFGQRFVDILSRQKKNHIEYSINPGEYLDIDEVFIPDNIDNLIINGHETSTGVLFDIDSLGKKYTDKTLIVDAISMTLTDKVDMYSSNIDCLIFSSHKALSLHPGLSFIILNDKMIKKIRTQKLANESIYFDFNLYLDDIERGQTPFTPAIGIIYQLKSMLDEILINGKEYYSNKAKHLAEYFRNRIEHLPLEIYSQSLPNAITSLKITNGANVSDLILSLNKHNVFITPNGGELKNMVFRVSHMGNQEIEDIDYLIYLLEKELLGKV